MGGDCTSLKRSLPVGMAIPFLDTVRKTPMLGTSHEPQTD